MHYTTSCLITCTALSLLSHTAHAQNMGELTARGAGFALVVSEKCAKRPESLTVVTSRQRNLFEKLQRAGYDFDSLKRGYLVGTMAAEGRYPSTTKPPRKECEDAEKVKREIAKI